MISIKRLNFFKHSKEARMKNKMNIEETTNSGGLTEDFENNLTIIHIFKLIRARTLIDLILKLRVNS